MQDELGVSGERGSLYLVLNEWGHYGKPDSTVSQKVGFSKVSTVSWPYVRV